VLHVLILDDVEEDNHYSHLIVLPPFERRKYCTNIVNVILCFYVYFMTSGNEK